MEQLFFQMMMTNVHLDDCGIFIGTTKEKEGLRERIKEFFTLQSPHLRGIEKKLYQEDEVSEEDRCLAMMEKYLQLPSLYSPNGDAWIWNHLDKLFHRQTAYRKRMNLVLKEMGVSIKMNRYNVSFERDKSQSMQVLTIENVYVLPAHRGQRLFESFANSLRDKFARVVIESLITEEMKRASQRMVKSGKWEYATMDHQFEWGYNLRSVPVVGSGWYWTLRT